MFPPLSFFQRRFTLYLSVSACKYSFRQRVYPLTLRTAHLDYGLLQGHKAEREPVSATIPNLTSVIWGRMTHRQVTSINISGNQSWNNLAGTELFFFFFFIPSHCPLPLWAHKMAPDWHFWCFLSLELCGTPFPLMPPKVTVMIHQRGIVGMCTINSSCTEYVIISKHLWIVIAPWLRPPFPIKLSFIPLICRTTIFHSDCLAWIFISVILSPLPITAHCSSL